MNETEGPGTVEGARPQFDQTQLQYALDQIRGEQSLAMGTIAGACAALAGAGLWALITVIAKIQIGWMAVGVGFLVGAAIRKFGRGIDRVFGIVGAVLALLGCGAGNLLSVCGMIAHEENIGFFEVVSRLDPEIIQQLMVATFSPIDLLFYGIAAYEGYRLSIRQVTEQDLTARITGHVPAGQAAP